MSWTPEPARDQTPLASQPYDRWVSPNGECMAEFHRHKQGYLVRFPHQADFLIEQNADGIAVKGWPTHGCDRQTVENIHHNAIQPLLGNHSGGLFLHGSAVEITNPEAGSQETGVVAFLGLSRGGKTTLAGSLAKAGHPFLTEDVIDLRLSNGQYWLQPKRPKLRLFADSARFLLGENTPFGNEDMKQDLEGGDALPFAKSAAPLRQIYLLGTDHKAQLSIRQLGMQEALTALMPHAFLLDVEDKPRLKSHFARMADLARDIPCYALDFTRDYDELPRVRQAVLENFACGPR